MAEASGLRIGRFAGAPVLIDPSILLLALFLTTLAFMDGGFAALPGAISLLIALMLGVLLHEFAHAGVAAAFKLRSLRIVLTFFGGHVEFAEQPKKRWQDIAVSAAGPLANLATWGVLALFAQQITRAPPLLYGFFLDLAFVSFLLGVFNLLPGFPLDGGRILTALLSYRLTPALSRVIAAVCGMFVAAGLAVYALFYMQLWTLMIAGILGLAAFAEFKIARGLHAQRAGGESANT